MLLKDLQGSDDKPIYERIAEQVKFAVASGVLRPGDLVPSVRELSKQLVVNPNTVARAYRELQNESVVEPVRGTGLVVSENALAQCKKDRKEIVRKRLREAIAEARLSRLDAHEIEAIFREEWSRTNGVKLV